MTYEQQAGETMNIDLKIKHFRDTSISEARALAEEQIEAHQHAMAQMEVEHKLAKKKAADFTVKAENENARREFSRILSASALEQKHNISRKQQELKDQLFHEVGKLLNDFKKTPEYQDYLLTKIREAITFAGDDLLHIFLSSTDAELLSSLKEKSGYPLEISEEDFGGGILATIPDKNIQINNTFRNSLKAVYKEFTFDGGARV